MNLGQLYLVKKHIELLCFMITQCKYNKIIYSDIEIWYNIAGASYTNRENVSKYINLMLLLCDTLYLLLAHQFDKYCMTLFINNNTPILIENKYYFYINHLVKVDQEISMKSHMCV